MERRKWLAVKEYSSQVPERPAYYEDRAKPAWISGPVMAVAAAALILGGHFLSRRAGRRTGGNGGNQGGSASSGDSSNRDSTESRGNLPLNLAQLRAKRAEAAEARLAKEGSSTGSSALTPLGTILMLARKVDKLDEECSTFLSSVGTSTNLDPAQLKELARLLELLTQLQLKIDGVKGDETVRPHRKIQTTRVQSRLSALETLSSESSK
ncbi:hypothetical protein KC19_4G111000 [Ceratodon purpureus]|uniref:BAG domain-containing protein n=1 Tax=Ceratodon purpureus TaxID=3225 RepID=A0A8T0I9D5_CERPU|nr:hypothetical protein KC19_4G111000 [Ceratodon purpureus]